MFSREDWTLFRNLNTISQKAGVPLQNLRRLVMKELVDNALDECGSAEYGKMGNDTYWVLDEGKGIPLDADGIADLFSINRPLTSSKILRLPSRGALGNGLRVVVGTVMASGGLLSVETRGKGYRIGFNEQTGKSNIREAAFDSQTKIGTRITITLGKSVPEDYDDLLWAKQAKALKSATSYAGKSSPYWYDSDSFYELLMAAGDKSVAWIVGQFEGVKDADVAIATDALLSAGVSIKTCHGLSRDDADSILTCLRAACKPVSEKKIGSVDFAVKKYGSVEIKPGRGKHSAILPYVIEAYAIPINDNAADDNEQTEDAFRAFVNATPITGKVQINRHGATKVAAFGCGLKHYIKSVSKRKFCLFLNITIPYMPITTDGKEPNFVYFLDDLATVTSKATKKLKSALKKQTGKVKNIITDNLDEAVAKVSDNNQYRYSLRQLFYAIRPHVLTNPELGELDYGYFGRVIGEYEATYGELKGMYRDPRGTLYHPHTHETIPIGTISVEKYRRPEWTFNKIVYIEKEGLFEVLKQVGFPEKYDCALLSSKGYASRAVRDVIDLLGETDQEIKFFCVHDSDGPGTMIYQTLQEGTTARERRKVKIINLGLDPWEARRMGLQVETFAARKGKTPVARYVRDHYKQTHPNINDMDGYGWERWIQTNRVELNSMTSPEFVAWMESKMEEHNIGKVIPPEDVLRKHVTDRTEQIVRESVMQKILAGQGFESQVELEMSNRYIQLKSLDVNTTVETGLRSSPRSTWTGPLEHAAKEIAEKGL